MMDFQETKVNKPCHSIFSWLFIVIILFLLYLPFLLSVISSSFSVPSDVPLQGYAENHEKPAFTIRDFLESNYQNSFAAWFEQELKPRGVLVKTHATIQFHMFGLGNRIIGEENDIFEEGYINAEYCINGHPNYSERMHLDAMQEYVDKLVLLQSELAKRGIVLYVYITPSKAFFDQENVPDKYKMIAGQNSVTAFECFSELIENTTIPHLLCRNIKDELSYPAFYKTGIHWARTYEQKASARILSDLSELTNKSYRSITLGEVKQQNDPFLKDTDVYDLLNIWNNPYNQVFYEYEAIPERPYKYDTIRLLVNGTSFADGLTRDIAELYPYEDIFYMNRISYIWDISNNRMNHIESLDDLDFGPYLSQVDAICIESTEAELYKYSYGFVDYLLDYLAAHKEETTAAGNYVDRLICSMDYPFQSDSLHGFYHREGDFAWTKAYSKTILTTFSAGDNDLEIEFTVPEYLFMENREPVNLQVFIDGECRFERAFEEPFTGSIVLDNAIQSSSATCSVEIYADKSFIPSALGLNEDSRELSLQIRYIGGRR